MKAFACLDTLTRWLHSVKSIVCEDTPTRLNGQYWESFVCRVTPVWLDSIGVICLARERTHSFNWTVLKSVIVEVTPTLGRLDSVEVICLQGHATRLNRQ
jgi:hypothetical protein